MNGRRLIDLVGAISYETGPAASITFTGQRCPPAAADPPVSSAAMARRKIEDLSPATEVHAKHIAVARHVPEVAGHYSEQIRLAESRLAWRLAAAGLLEESAQLWQLVSEGRHWYDGLPVLVRGRRGGCYSGRGPVDYDEIAKEAAERVKARALRAERAGEDLDNLCPECNGMTRHAAPSKNATSTPQPRPVDGDEKRGLAEDQAVEELQTFLDQVSPDDFRDGAAE